MTKEEIISQIESYIKQSINGQEIENNKIEFKSQWYNLTNPKDQNEFIKDTSAIANTFGLDGFIVIGFDPKTKMFQPSRFTDCGQKDSSDLLNLVNKKVDRLFDLNLYDETFMGNQISIIHIPPSIDKPHVITNYQTFDQAGKIKKEEQQRIFVRKNSSTYPANKSDLELMYYDRKNVIPEYKILTLISPKRITFNHTSDNPMVCTGVSLLVPMFLENLGRRTVSISTINITIALFDDPSHSELMHISAPVYGQIILKPGDIAQQLISFSSSDFATHPLPKAKEWIQAFRDNVHHLIFSNNYYVLSNGKQITTDVELANF